MNLLITGGSGFIGSNLIIYLTRKYPKYNIINVDLKKSKYLKPYQDKYTFLKGNICNKNFINKVFKNYKINSVIHLAAESHVDNSIEKPFEFIINNTLGTFVLLDAFRLMKIKGRFHYVSTDEIYGSLKENKFFETSAFSPSNPYSASKASGNHFVNAYYKTFDLNVVTTNSSNNYGPNQNKEKLIPKIIQKAIKGEKIPIYGNGKNIRDWIFVEDNCRAIDLVFHKGKKGNSYNIGGDNEISNIEIARTICKILDELKPKKTKYEKQIAFIKDRLGHDFRYGIDFSKIKKELNWTPSNNFLSKLKETVKWCVEN